MSSKRRTSPIVTEYEIIKALGCRVMSLLQSPAFIESTSSNMYKIAIDEIRERKSPIIIKRSISTDPRDGEEEWNINEMEILNLDAIEAMLIS